MLTGQRKVERINGSGVVRVGTKQAPLTREELTRLKAGQAVKPRTVDSYVELSRRLTERIFVVLAEFGNERAPGYPDKDTDPATPGPATFQGPLHNKIQEPDRSKDNSTVWQANFSAEHYRQLYFGDNGVESLKTCYEEQSSGRYSVDGEVTDWVKVKYNEAAYGRSDDPNEGTSGDDPAVCGSNVCSNT